MCHPLGSENIQDLKVIRLIPVYIPKKCYKKAVFGSEVKLHYVFRLENENGLDVVQSSYKTLEYLSFKIGENSVIKGKAFHGIKQLLNQKL